MFRRDADSDVLHLQGHVVPELQINGDKGAVVFSLPKTFTVLHRALTLTPFHDFGRELEHTLQARPHKPTTSPDLTYALEAEWEQIPVARYQNVYQEWRLCFARQNDVYSLLFNDR